MNSAKELFEIGAGLLDTYKYEKAIDFFTKSIDIDPVNSEAFELRGNAFYHLLKIPEAILDLQKAVALDPNNHNAWYNKGQIHFFRKEFDEAEICYLKANEIYEDSLFYLSALAELYLKLKKPELSISYATKIINESPADVIALNLRALAFGRIKDYKLAIKDCLKIIEVKGNKATSSYNNLGYYYSKIGELKKAENNLLIALKINPTDPYALDNLGHVYYQNNDNIKALEFINKSLEIDPSNSYGYKNRALVYLKEKKFAEAHQDLMKAKALGYTEDYDDEVEKLLGQLGF